MRQQTANGSRAKNPVGGHGGSIFSSERVAKLTCFGVKRLSGEKGVVGLFSYYEKGRFDESMSKLILLFVNG